MRPLSAAVHVSPQTFHLNPRFRPCSRYLRFQRDMGSGEDKRGKNVGDDKHGKKRRPKRRVESRNRTAAPDSGIVSMSSASVPNVTAASNAAVSSHAAGPSTLCAQPPPAQLPAPAQAAGAAAIAASSVSGAAFAVNVAATPGSSKRPVTMTPPSGSSAPSESKKTKKRTPSEERRFEQGQAREEMLALTTTHANRWAALTDASGRRFGLAEAEIAKALQVSRLFWKLKKKKRDDPVLFYGGELPLPPHDAIITDETPPRLWPPVPQQLCRVGATMGEVARHMHDNIIPSLAPFSQLVRDARAAFAETDAAAGGATWDDIEIDAANETMIRELGTPSEQADFNAHAAYQRSLKDSRNERRRASPHPATIVTVTVSDEGSGDEHSDEEHDPNYDLKYSDEDIPNISEGAGVHDSPSKLVPSLIVPRLSDAEFHKAAKALFANKSPAKTPPPSLPSSSSPGSQAPTFAVTSSMGPQNSALSLPASTPIMPPPPINFPPPIRGSDLPPPTIDPSWSEEDRQAMLAFHAEAVRAADERYAAHMQAVQLAQLQKALAEAAAKRAKDAQEAERLRQLKEAEEAEAKAKKAKEEADAAERVRLEQEAQAAAAQLAAAVPPPSPRRPETFQRMLWRTADFISGDVYFFAPPYNSIPYPAYMLPESLLEGPFADRFSEVIGTIRYFNSGEGAYQPQLTAAAEAARGVTGLPRNAWIFPGIVAHHARAFVFYQLHNPQRACLGLAQCTLLVNNRFITFFPGPFNCPFTHGSHTAEAPLVVDWFDLTRALSPYCGPLQIAGAINIDPGRHEQGTPAQCEVDATDSQSGADGDPDEKDARDDDAHS